MRRECRVQSAEGGGGLRLEVGGEGGNGGRGGRGRGGRSGRVVLFQVGAIEVGEGAGDVAEDSELEALDFGRPEGF